MVNEPSAENSRMHFAAWHGQDELSKREIRRTFIMTDTNFDTMPGQPAGDKGPEMFNAAFPDDVEQRLVINWMMGVKAAFEIDTSFVANDGGDKLERIGLVYPMHIIAMLADKALGPAGDCLDRLQERGFIVRPVEFKGANAVVAAIPLDEALRQAKVWANGDCDEARDCPSISAFGNLPQGGFVSGTVEML
jgi:hypothetical protein